MATRKTAHSLERHRRTGLGLLEDADDLTVAKSGLLHLESPSLTLRENSTSKQHYFSGGLPVRTYSVDDGYSDWTRIQAVGRPGGVFVHLKGIADGADIQFKIEDGDLIYVSKTESQWIKIDLEIQQ